MDYGSVLEFFKADREALHDSRSIWELAEFILIRSTLWILTYVAQAVGQVAKDHMVFWI